MSRLSPDNLGDLIDGRVTLHFFCEARGCHHNAAADMQALADRLGRDHPYLNGAITRRMKCTRCGSKQISCVLQPYYGERAKKGD